MLIRPPTLDDADDIARLRNALHLAEIGTVFTDTAEVRAQLTGPDLDLATDWILAFADDGELVGSATIFPDASGELYLDNYVDPAHVGEGIGSVLLSWGEERAQQLSALAPPGERVVLRHGIWIGATLTEAFFAAHGYQPVRFFQQIEMTMTEPPPQPSWPEGIAVRTMVLGEDDHALHAASLEAMAEHWGYGDRPFDAWRHHLTEQDGFSPELVFMALADNLIVGDAVCLAGTAADPEGGYLFELGVRPAWRGQGIGVGLLREAFCRLYERGIRHVETMVDSENPSGALGIYERAGMRPTYGYTTIEKELVPGQTG